MHEYWIACARKSVRERFILIADDDDDSSNSKSFNFPPSAVCDCLKVILLHDSTVIQSLKTK